MKNINIYLILLFLLFFNNFIIGLPITKPLTSAENTCVKNLLTKAGMVNSPPFSNYLDTLSGDYDLCLYFECYQEDNGGTPIYYLKNFQLTYSGSGNPAFSLGYSDLSCFDRLDLIEIIGFKLDSNNLLGTGSLKGLAKKVTLEKCTSLTFPTIISTITEVLTLRLIEPLLGVVNSSAFKTLKSLIIINLPQSTAVPIRIVNNFQPFEIGLIDYFTDQVPVLTGFTITTLNVQLTTGFTNSNNFNTFNLIDTVNLEVLTDQITFPVNLFTAANNIKHINLNSKFNAPTSLIDISAATNLKSFIFNLKISSANFVYPSSGGFPFTLPTTLEVLEYNGALLQISNFGIFSNLKSLKLNSDQISGNFPSKSVLPQIKEFSIKDNNLFGTLTNDWCNTILDVSYNIISGNLPTCFFCYYDSLQNYYVGTNIIYTGLTCDLKPLPGLTFNEDGNFQVYGKNLGYFSPISHPHTSTQVITANELFQGFWDVSTNAAPSTIDFEFMGQNFTLATIPNVPTFTTSIISSINAGIITHSFEGNYFSYIATEIIIMINQVQCVVTFSTFSAVSCTIPVGSSSANGFYVAYFKVKDLETQLTILDTAPTGNTYSQVNLCDPFCKNGYCITSNNPPSCDCGGQFLGDDCSITPRSCLNDCTDSNHGTCNPITGQCQCNRGWKGNDCSYVFIDCYYNCLHGGYCNDNIGQCNCFEPYYGEACQFMHCPNNCTSPDKGTCDTDSGVCTCELTYQGLDCSLPFIPCTMTCLNGGSCNDQKGICFCPNEYQGVDCSRPYKPCPLANAVECNAITGLNLNSCNNETGICTCDSAHQSLNCGLPYKECINNCNGIQGQCNNQTGVCTCITDYTGLDCSLPSQYISSISSTTTAGGLVSITGWFGMNHTGLSIKIGSLDCNVQFINQSFINCTIGAESGTKNVTMVQNGITWNGKDIYHYEENTYSCPNDCSNHGVCNTKFGFCRCTVGYGGFDCNGIKNEVSTTTTTTTASSTTTSSTTSTTEPVSTPKPIIIPPTITKVNPIVGSATINNQQTSYEILISSLVEINFNGDTIRSHTLQQQWNSVSSDNNIYQFSQTIKNTNCTITYSIEELKQSRDYEFAGLELSLEQDSIKISVKIENYPYLNSLNTLQLQMQSKIGTIESTDNGGECNDENTKIDTDKLDKNKILNYITIEKNKKVLYGRFINRVISDTHPTFITTSVIPNDDTSDTTNKSNIIIIGLNLPIHCQICIIDPDFSLLVSNSYQSTCDNQSNSSKRPLWILPVAIVIPCLALVALTIVGAIIFRKHRTKILLAKGSFKFSLKNLSKKHRESLYMPNNN